MISSELRGLSSLSAERRRFARVPTQAGHACRLELARDEARLASVLDLSPDGAKVESDRPPSWADGHTMLVLAAGGLKIPCLADVARRIEGPGQGAVAGAGHTEGTPRTDRSLWGLRLQFRDADASLVAAAYHRLRFGSLDRRGELPAERVRGLFEESGYLGLRSHLQPSEEWLRAAWPETLSHDAVYRSRSGRPLGHISITRAYAEAWLGHEIATLRDDPEALECRRQLYHHFSVWPRLLDGERAIVFGYYNRARPWHRMMFEQFAAGMDDSLCAVLPLDRYVEDDVRFDGSDRTASDGLSTGRTPSVSLWPGNMPSGGSSSGSVTIEPMAAGEDEAIVSLIQSQWPALALRTFDMSVGRLRQASLHPDYGALGLKRARDVLVVRNAGRLVGAALCEETGGDLSIFGVLNAAQVFLKPQVREDAALRSAVAQAVVGYYRARGLPMPFLSCPPGTWGGIHVPGFRFAETMGCIMFTAEALRQFEVFVDQAISRMPDKSSDDQWLSGKV